MRAAAFTSRTADPALGAFAVRDTDLPLVRGFAGPLALVVTGGAGQVAGPAGLCARLGLHLARVEITLRDLDDPHGNARRVVAAVDDARAAGSLGGESAVHIEMPAAPAGAGWLAAADEVAAADLRLTLPPPVDGSALLGWVDAALDRELPFTIRGLRHAVSSVSAFGFVNVLVATQLLFDGLPDPLSVLAEQDSARLLERVGGRRPRTGQALVHVLRVRGAAHVAARAGRPGSGRRGMTTLFGLDNLPYGVFSVDGDRPRVGVRLHDTVVDAHRLTGRAELGGPDLGAFMGLGPSVWREVRELAGLACPGRRGHPARRGEHAPAVRGGGLRRLLLLAASRHQRRADLPARRRAAQCQLETPPDRLPRSCRDRGHLRHGRRPPARPAPGEWWDAVVRAEPAARPRGRARLRGRGADRPRHVGAHRGLRAARLRGDAAERLVGPRHPGLGVTAAGTVPRQVVRDLDQPVDHATRRPRGGPGAVARPGPGAAGVPAAWPSPPATTSHTRWCSTARW